jgi:amino acid adenylation domain-containing protein
MHGQPRMTDASMTHVRMTDVAPVDTIRSLRSGFRAFARATPDAPALVVADVVHSYAQLDQVARRWARVIVDAQGGPAARVGIFGSRSLTSYTGVLAALYSGAAFVPLNPTFPAARTRAMIERAGLDAIIVDRGAAKQLAAVLDGLATAPPILAPEHESLDLQVPKIVFADAIASATPLTELPTPPADAVAYLLFTSGSTGVPKGVPVTHGNALHFMDFASARYAITASDRLSQTFDQTFDLSVFDLFVAWENGACVYAMQPLDLLAPARFVQRHALTVWFSVPSIPALMRKKNSLKPDIFPTLRWSLFCGEPLPRASAEAWQTAAPNSQVENLYGPTELTIACLTYRWDAVASPALCVNDVVPIGRPFDGLTEVLLDEARQPVADGEPGELCVCGPQTVPGYWQSPEKTAEQFVLLPLADGRTERFYRTGDRVRRLSTGDYVYLGRVDHQVKVLGHRVELAEVEAVISKHEGVTQAVAMGWPVRDGSAEGLVAFVTGRDVDPRDVTTRVRAALPDYMTPRTIFVVDALPLNANGKIDRPVLLQRLENGQFSLPA